MLGYSITFPPGSLTILPPLCHIFPGSFSGSAYSMRPLRVKILKACLKPFHLWLHSIFFGKFMYAKTTFKLYISLTPNLCPSGFLLWAGEMWLSTGPLCPDLSKASQSENVQAHAHCSLPREQSNVYPEPYNEGVHIASASPLHEFTLHPPLLSSVPRERVPYILHDHTFLLPAVQLCDGNRNSRWEVREQKVSEVREQKVHFCTLSLLLWGCTFIQLPSAGSLGLTDSHHFLLLLAVRHCGPFYHRC